MLLLEEQTWLKLTHRRHGEAVLVVLRYFLFTAYEIFFTFGRDI